MGGLDREISRCWPLMGWPVVGLNAIITSGRSGAGRKRPLRDLAVIIERSSLVAQIAGTACRTTSRRRDVPAGMVSRLLEARRRSDDRAHGPSPKVSNSNFSR